MRSYRVPFLAGMLLYASLAWAQSTSLPLTDDAFINGAKPDVETGSWATIVVHSYGPKYGLVRFDAASIAGQDISEATLTLYLNSLRLNGTVSAHAVTTGWNEGTVTWNNQPTAETVATAIMELTTGDVGGVIAIDVTAAVRRWADGSLADAGFMIITSEGIKAVFDAKEMAGGVPATLTVETGAVISDGRAIVLDFTDPDDCVIDEPGYYILDRSWDLGDAQSNVACTAVAIDAIEITLDLRGFEIRGVPGSPTISRCPDYNLSPDANSPVIRNGSVIGDPDAISCIASFAMLENLYIHGDIAAHQLTIADSEISNGRIEWEGSSHDGIGPSKLVNNRMLDCREGLCLDVGFGGYPSYPNVIQNNHFEGGVETEYSDATITGNVFHLNRDAQHPAIHSRNSSDVIAWNIIETIRAEGTGTGIRVESTSNYESAVVDGNVIRGTAVGIEFRSDGHFYGNNRVSASTPFIGTDSQTDWGGNVSF